MVTCPFCVHFINVFVQVVAGGVGGGDVNNFVVVVVTGKAKAIIFQWSLATLS